MNFGGFAAGLSQGLDTGIRQGRTIRDLIKEGKLEDLRTKGLEEAKAARESAVNDSVKDNPAVQSGPVIQQENVVAQPIGDDGAVTPAQAMQTPVTQSQLAVPVAEATPVQPASSSTTPTQQSVVAGGLAQSGMDQSRAVDVADPVASPMAGGYNVHGKNYATREEAWKAADKAAPSTMDYFMKNAVPKLQEQYIVNGEPEKADAWGKWAENSQNRDYMKTWSKMHTAVQLGDVSKAADYAFDLYKKFDDGITPLSKEVVKDKAGNLTGFNVRLKNDETGEETAQFIDQKSLISMGLAGLAPDKQFEAVYSRQGKVDDAAMQFRLKEQERKQSNQDKLTLEQYKEDRADKRDIRKGNQKLSEITLENSLQTAGYGAKEKAKVQSKIDILKNSGKSDDEINALIPDLVGIEGYKKATTPAERAAIIDSDLTKNDPRYSRLSPAEQQAKVQEKIKSYDNIAADLDKVKPAKPTTDNTAKRSVVSAKPIAYDKSLPVKWNKHDGKPYHYVDGKYIPIEGGTVPSTGQGVEGKW